ncbi:FadR family transcriptional regulator [Exilibacterium tricleocarpae]|uniref:FadR family transcriptional regulator n=1 Tax=Exilibacterium tricleocarpae TaxID=2591008 RepID=A0A545TNH6_9GAMM|nr:FadR/GntR family transcriptional regulator [Exilibacterium tricleocarpae]TQV78738.1 FadR family transcriptional regulator [Exilibacterium tricleocarpae]
MKQGQSTNGQRLYQQVVDKMLAVLDSGEYAAGVRLPSERELSERFGVSRPTIREAIIALEVMGRVAVKTGSGVYVLKHQQKNDDVHDFSPFELTEARVLIEGEAVALAASMITADQLKQLAQALEEMAAENEAGHLTSEVADRKFHAIISKATQNRMLADTIERLWYIQEHSQDIHLAHQSVCKKDGQRRLAEHKAIYDALAKGDSQAARTAMRNHFSRLIEALHDATEAQAVEEMHRKVSERRQRFSLNRLENGFADNAY